MIASEVKTLLNTAVIQMDGRQGQQEIHLRLFLSSLNKEIFHRAPGTASGRCNLGPRVVGAQIANSYKNSVRHASLSASFLRQNSKRRENRVSGQTTIAATPEMSVCVRTKHKPVGTTVPEESLSQNSENVRLLNKRNSAMRQMQRDEIFFFDSLFTASQRVSEARNTTSSDPERRMMAGAPQTPELTTRRENAMSASNSDSVETLENSLANKSDPKENGRKFVATTRPSHPTVYLQRSKKSRRDEASDPPHL